MRSKLTFLELSRHGFRELVRKVGILEDRVPCVRIMVDLASLSWSSFEKKNKGERLGPPLFWFHLSERRRHVANILLAFSGCLNSLHWPAGEEDFGKFGNSYLEVMIMFDHWVDHRLLIEKVSSASQRSMQAHILLHVP